MSKNTICTRMNNLPIIAFHIGCIIYIARLKEPFLKVIEVHFNYLLAYFIATFGIFKAIFFTLNITKTMYVSRIIMYKPLNLFLTRYQVV